MSESDNVRGDGRGGVWRLSDVAPDIAAMIAAQEAHQAECEADPCERCGRLPVPELRVVDPDVDSWTEKAIASLPAAFEKARLSSDWLRAVVGEAMIAKAKANLPVRHAIFVGPPGAGKTSLAVAMFRERLEVDRPKIRGHVYPWAQHRYVSSHALAKSRAMHPLGAGESPLVETALTTPLLLLDELGGEDERHGAAVREIIYERHAAGRATWITTGVSLKTLAERYGGGIARRVSENALVFRLGKADR